MARKKENSEFVCLNCGRAVVPLTNGSYRNHCPFCLYSRHLDVALGDRLSECGGLMEPVGLERKSGKGFQILHRCTRCGHESVNKAAVDTAQPDDVEEIIGLQR